MSTKALVIIIATSICLFVCFTGRFGVDFAKTEHVQSASIINFDRIERLPVIGAILSKEKISSIRINVCEYIQNHPLTRQCREQPILFGMLGMLVGASVLGLGLLIHLIRSDARFG